MSSWKKQLLVSLTEMSALSPEMALSKDGKSVVLNLAKDRSVVINDCRTSTLKVFKWVIPWLFDNSRWYKELVSWYIRRSFDGFSQVLYEDSGSGMLHYFLGDPTTDRAEGILDIFPDRIIFNKG